MRFLSAFVLLLESIHAKWGNVVIVNAWQDRGFISSCSPSLATLSCGETVLFYVTFAQLASTSGIAA